MSIEEWMKLKIGDYVYRNSDGWGGFLTSAPATGSEFSDSVILSFRTIISYPRDNKTYPDWVKASEHEQWTKMDVVTCTNALAYARYATVLNSEIVTALKQTTIL